MGTALRPAVQSKRMGSGHATYLVAVYQYLVNGQIHQRQTIKASEQFFNVRTAGQVQETANRYRIGTQLMVYYNPANPQESALER